MISVRYSDKLEFYEIYSWCENNCQGAWYTGTDWKHWVVGESNKMVEFVNKNDAVLFALKWT